MILKINILFAALVLLELFRWSLSTVPSDVQVASNDGFHHQISRHLGGGFSRLLNDSKFKNLNQELENWDLMVEGFSHAYYDRIRGAIAVNTIEQPTDKWAAATTLFKMPSGQYTIRFTSLLESDGESTYKVLIDEKQVLEFQNPRIFGKDTPEYAPHIVEVKQVDIKSGSKIRVEFLPHSNGLVPEGEGFGYARARWSNNIEFIPN